MASPTSPSHVRARSTARRSNANQDTVSNARSLFVVSMPIPVAYIILVSTHPVAFVYLTQSQAAVTMVRGMSPYKCLMWRVWCPARRRVRYIILIRYSSTPSIVTTLNIGMLLPSVGPRQPVPRRPPYRKCINPRRGRQRNYRCEREGGAGV